MDVYTTEDQQVEAIKKWWRQNKWSLIGGVALGIVVIVGGRAWLENRQAYNAAASSVFQTMDQQLAQGNLEEAGQNASLLLNEFSNTPYAALGALALAKIKVEEGETDAALSQLQWVLNNAEDAAVLHVARLRMARLQLYQGRMDDAMNLIDNIETGSYSPAYAQLKGDILMAKGDHEGARQSYTTALEALAPGSSSRQVVQMKLDDLGGNLDTSVLQAEIGAQ